MLCDEHDIIQALFVLDKYSPLALSAMMKCLIAILRSTVATSYLLLGALEVYLLHFQFYLNLINLNFSVNSHIRLVAILVDQPLYWISSIFF